MAREGGNNPDFVYAVHLPDSAQAAVQQAAQTQNGSSKWSFAPFNFRSETNCTVAAAATLGVGGIPGFPVAWPPFLSPASFNDTMSQLANYSNSGVRRLNHVPW